MPPPTRGTVLRTVVCVECVDGVAGSIPRFFPHPGHLPVGEGEIFPHPDPLPGGEGDKTGEDVPHGVVALEAVTVVGEK